MKKSYVFDQLHWDDLQSVLKRMAIIVTERDKVTSKLPTSITHQAWFDAHLIASAQLAVEVDFLRNSLDGFFGVADLDLDDYGACCQTCGVYYDQGKVDYDGLCPACQPDDAGAEADRRGDERRNAEMEARMEK